MAWIYLAELAGSHLLSANGCDQSPIVKLTVIARASYCRECDQVTLVQPQSGTMCELSKERCYQKSISSTGASHVRTSVLPEMAKAWKDSVADYFSRSYVWSKNSTQLSLSLKMFQPFDLEALEPSSPRWPQRGMIAGGRCYQQKKLELHTSAKDGSYLLPTPSASSYGSNQGGAAGRTGKIRHSLETMARKNLWPTPTTRDRIRSEKFRRGRSLSPREQTGGLLNPQWVEWLMGYPIGWTELKDWAMQWFRSKRVKRSKNLSE